MNAGGTFLNTERQDIKHESEPDLVHALQTVVANFEPLDDFHLNLHEFDILNLLTSISTSKKKTLENKHQQPSCKYIRRMKNSLLSHDTEVVVCCVVCRNSTPVTVETRLNSNSQTLQ